MVSGLILARMGLRCEDMRLMGGGTRLCPRSRRRQRRMKSKEVGFRRPSSASGRPTSLYETRARLTLNAQK